MTLEEVKQFLQDNQDDEAVKAYIGELSAVSEDKVKGFLETDEGKRMLQPTLDRYHTKSLDTWKTNHLQGLLDQAKEEGKQEANPNKSPEQLRIEELEKKIAESEKESQKEKLRNTAFTIAEDKQLPKDIAEMYLGDDEESTKANLEALEQSWTKHTTKIKDDLFKQNGREIGSGEGANLSPAERIAQQNNQQKETPKSDLWNTEGGS